MKIYDCITYFDEPMLFEVRLNILNSYVDEFVVSEAIFTHSGEKKKINFDKFIIISYFLLWYYIILRLIVF